MADASQTGSRETGRESQKDRRQKRIRCRTGCRNCRRRRKKCNGKQPTCENCSRKGEICEWGVKLSFRPENNYSISDTHPSMRQALTFGHDTTIEFCDITHEIIRDYQTNAHVVEGIRNDSEQGDSNNAERYVSSWASRHQPRLPYERQTNTSTPMGVSETGVMARPSDSDRHAASTYSGQPGSDSPSSMNSTESLMMLQSAAAQLLDLGCAPPSTEPDRNCSSTEVSDEHSYSTGIAAISPTARDDGIFLPGSTYLELHSTLRDRIFDTTLAAQSSRATSPRILGGDDMTDSCTQVDYETASIGPGNPISPPTSSPLFAELEWQEEYKLWKNWVDEIAPWLDKFDNDCHFGRTLPVMAQDHRHLRCSMLALSARQQEQKHSERRSSASLALYQEAVHQLIPQLQTRSTAVVASCVVLCVLEMMSCSPNMWRRHLDGCASLIQSVGINGFSNGLEKALFWCFARMDVCGGFISSQRTLIPVNSWSSETTLEQNVRLYRETSCFCLYADYSVFLCALVLDLFASDHTEDVYVRRWNELFGYIEDWYNQRPPEMRSILELNAPKEDYFRPFPIILFSNPAAVSGNQLYHTAALLMLQRKPRDAFIQSKRLIIWHARMPLWIAGKVMSHPSEHQAILDIYATIEKETGWGAKWRADDLKSYWGDLDV
ncbi:hypothetical protein F4679DRAFT_578930 [Xylaria curta]|nr:hypothetical protein F4679DRAFT_578930 [Xylaria curta]